MITKGKSTTQGVRRKYYPFDHPYRHTVKGNKCVLLMDMDIPVELLAKFPDIHRTWFNGYVAIPIERVPPELMFLSSGSYLSFINVPGGITYCEPSVNNRELQKIALDSFHRRLENIRRSKKDTQAEFIEYMDERREAENLYRKDLIDLGAAEVVYGFDCGHAGHEKVKEYNDAKFIYRCVLQMENQLNILFKRYKELESSEPEHRATIIEEIRDSGDISNEVAIIPLVFGSGKFTDEG